MLLLLLVVSCYLSQIKDNQKQQPAILFIVVKNQLKIATKSNNKMKQNKEKEKENSNNTKRKTITTKQCKQ